MNKLSQLGLLMSSVNITITIRGRKITAIVYDKCQVCSIQPSCQYVCVFLSCRRMFVFTGITWKVEIMLPVHSLHVSIVQFSPNMSHPPFTKTTDAKIL